MVINCRILISWNSFPGQIETNDKTLVRLCGRQSNICCNILESVDADGYCVAVLSVSTKRVDNESVKHNLRIFQQLPRNPTRLEVQLRFVMHSTFVCSSTFLLLADGMPAKRGRGASPETSRVVQRVDREEETRTAASDRGEASRAERSRTPPPVAARATWRWCWILTIQDGGEEVWWWRWWRQ